MIHLEVVAVFTGEGTSLCCCCCFCKLERCVDLEAGKNGHNRSLSRSLAWLRLEWQICRECDWQMQIVQTAYFKHKLYLKYIQKCRKSAFIYQVHCYDLHPS